MPPYQKTGTGIIDKAAACEAVQMAFPSIEKVLQRPLVSGEQALHLVIMDPTVEYGTVLFEQAILHEQSIGFPETWKADYRSFARGKAELAWRAGCDTHHIQDFRPHMLRAGDTLLWGGVCREGLIVAASGAHPWFDEAFSNAVAGFLLAIAHEKARAAREKGTILSGVDTQAI